ncbi:hypothetical protein AVEN_73202-1 [Araneus ventricosus]|uniref:Uncharacterized protein n=1 Tax=Araneus ventricosus TaxID=182803 RepID=A0A4Y1ZTC7_ARAVE|nr:hypothetical protein AVEN_73202-1 [Araneus ventricosus]
MKCFGTVVSLSPVASEILTDYWNADRKEAAVDDRLDISNLRRNIERRRNSEPWIASPGNGRRPIPEIAADGCRNQSHIPLDLDGGSHVS